MAPPFRDNSRGKGTVMGWARILAYVTGTVDQELLARNKYLAAENRILKSQLNGRLKLSDAEPELFGNSSDTAKDGFRGVGAGERQDDKLPRVKTA